MLALGTIEWLHPGYHDEKRLWPVGYVAERVASTPASGNRAAPHLCQVDAAPDGSGPVFRSPSPPPSPPYHTDHTAQGAQWTQTSLRLPVQRTIAQRAPIPSSSMHTVTSLTPQAKKMQPWE